MVVVDFVCVVLLEGTLCGGTEMDFDSTYILLCVAGSVRTGEGSSWLKGPPGLMHHCDMLGKLIARAIIQRLL